VLTHTLHYGMGVFEGVRAYKTPEGTAIFRLKEHTRRLFNSAKIFQMAMPFDEATLEAAQREVVRANNLSRATSARWCGSAPKSSACRPRATRSTWPSPPGRGAYLGEEGMERGIRVKTSSFTRHHVNVSLVRAKAAGYYINSILANQEATGLGYDEALLLDTEGYVSEGSGENVFIVRNGVIYTPDLASCLDGITRDATLTIAATSASRCARSASRATRCTAPTKRSSPAPPPK
jgi:branched-chain amino acid aminotransferase